MARGRKRKLRPRWRNGRLKPSPEEIARRMEPRGETVDPTPETMAHRQLVFGSPTAPGELCSTLDRLRSRLTQEQYWAGQYARSVYARYCIAIGVPRLVAGQLTDYVQGGGVMPMPADQAADAMAAYDAATTAIQRQSKRALLEVQRIMHNSPPRNVDTLINGLTVLADFLGLQSKKTG